ncbi:protein GAMETE EXPRESSED 2 isoform X1 [Lycium ferocissimum]|uniref:protein GAMETE EXPRESSED 2 isoform X1 n=3 Tax=Lycium ferocissimum TaxID=112874 RepID=UPI0028162005|nr:protein GAMETE EXPRESSED 2 isoform X1 [Lycium ferocissimum]
MANQLLLCTILVFFIISLTHQLSLSEDLAVPSFAFSWVDNNDKFVAGDVATIMVKVIGNFDPAKFKHPFNPNISVNDKMGNSSYISGVSSNFGGNFGDWRISFVPIMTGLFNVLITDDHFNVFDSSLHFQVTPGNIYPSASVVSWKNGVSEFVAGTKASLTILPKDAFGNNISSASEGLNSYNFTLSISTFNGSVANMLNFTNKGWDISGYLVVEFIVSTAGSFLLNIQGDNQTLRGCPLMFIVNPGSLDVSKCLLQWEVETKYFQIFSLMEGFIHQHDQYGNLVPGLYEFDVEVIENGTDLIIPVTDIQFKQVGLGIQLFSFSLTEPGDFKLMIYHKEHNNSISTMPFHFTVYIGYCDGMNSIVNGSGLNDSVAGEAARFSVFLKDAYLYPSVVELEILQVQVVNEFDSYHAQASIHPTKMVNGTLCGTNLNCGALNDVELGFTPLADTKLDPRNMRFSAFDVNYIPERSGIYEIRVFCGNIPLNGGHPFRKAVSAGKVNISLSGPVKFSPKVPKLTKNDITIQLMDSYFNPVLLQQSKLKLEIGSVNRSGFSTWTFIDNEDGTYSGSYLAKDVGTYELCASFDGMRFMPCPFGVNVYTSEYFPRVQNDSVWVWEDDSIAFDALENDYFAGHNITISEFSKPGHGSTLQYGHLFRYTPFKGFYGRDSFYYTICDVNGNIASGGVDISVLSIPPQFVSVPSKLLATEDVISPRFGGFSGLEIIYSDSTENISITFSAQSGIIFLSPLLMQFWQPTWSISSMSKEVGKTTELTLTGCLEEINFAIQSLQYFGNENFYGTDTIQVSTMNKNGKNELDIPILVEPINDPPLIDLPSFVIMDQGSEEVFIFTRGRNKSAVFVGDPDLLHYPGNASRFLVMFSVEVSSGFLSTKLPANLISTTELKLKTSYQWQPLQTFVTISEHFMVKAKGIRFRGTLEDCNSVLEQLLYHGDEHRAILIVTVNDMGNYGCYPDCTEMMSMPHLVEASVSLMRERPLSSLFAHAFGSAIIIEFILVLSLSVILLFFICKCSFVLINEKRRQASQEFELSNVQNSQEGTLTEDLSDKMTRVRGCCSNFCMSNLQLSKFYPWSCLQLGIGRSPKPTNTSSKSSSDQLEMTSPSGLSPSASAKDKQLSAQLEET